METGAWGSFNAQRGFQPEEKRALVVIRTDVEHFVHLIVIARMAIVVDALADHVKLSESQLLVDIISRVDDVTIGG